MTLPTTENDTILAKRKRSIPGTPSEDKRSMANYSKHLAITDTDTIPAKPVSVELRDGVEVYAPLSAEGAHWKPFKEEYIWWV